MNHDEVAQRKLDLVNRNDGRQIETSEKETNSEAMTID